MMMKVSEGILERRSKAFQKAVAPVSVSMAQARVTLRAAGLLAPVQAAIDTAKALNPAIGDAWEYATELRRDSAMVLHLAKVMGLTDAQVDALFKAASEVTF